MNIHPLLACDFYKTGHIFQYPAGTQKIYSNFTARSSRLSAMPSSFDEKVVFFGLQYFIKSFLINRFNCVFFNNETLAMSDYERTLKSAIGDLPSYKHIRDLKKLGYLPLEIKALPEGSRVNIKVPMLTIENTHEDFYWLTNYIETAMSCMLWKPITVATIAFEYRRILNKYVDETGSNSDFANWQCHDFSMRGMANLEDAAVCGAAHLLSHYGTDTIPSIQFIKDYYHGDTVEFVAGSVPATEHSVMCAGGRDSEIQTFKRLITEIYPSGVVSIVSDTWDFWKVITFYAKELKSDILNRKANDAGLAKVVFRPDSGDPVKIIVGDPDAENGSPKHKGAVQCLWEIFNGKINEKGFKTLNDAVGLIYGDSITLDRQNAILEGLKNKGFSAGNIVFGIGSYSYQFVTRDTFGMAMKATWAKIDGEGVNIFKDPITDNGTKKSAIGRLRVEKVNDDFVLYDKQQVSSGSGALETVFRNGVLERLQTFSGIRKLLNNQMESKT